LFVMPCMIVSPIWLISLIVNEVKSVSLYISAVYLSVFDKK
jgi:hypothetical protein